MAKDKGVSPTWIDVKTSLLTFDRAGLHGLLQDLYAASKENQAFFHARLGIGSDQLGPYKAAISHSVNPDLMRGRRPSVSKAKKAIADYGRAIGRPEGLAELSIFFCEEAISLVESCSFEDESFFVALIRMYSRSLTLVANLPLNERRSYLERLNALRSRSRHVGYGMQDELNSLWYDAYLEGQQE